MNTNNYFDVAIVLAAIAGCGFWIWWDERDRKERRRKAEETLARLSRENDQPQEATTIPSPLYQKSDSGGNHSS